MKKEMTQRLLLPLPILLVLAGCAGPIGVKQISPKESYEIRATNPLGSGQISDSAAAVLHRYNLLESLKKAPLQTILNLHDISRKDKRRDLLFTLSELSYLEGERMHGRTSSKEKKLAPDFFLQSAVYAYFFLLADHRGPHPSPYDVRFREACDLYNRSLWRAFPAANKDYLDLADSLRELPVGSLRIELKTGNLAWEYGNIERLLPSDAYRIRGFKTHNRSPGLGMPLIGLIKPGDEAPNGGTLPLTAFLRLPGGIEDFYSGQATGLLELYSAYDSSEVEVNGERIPLETDSTTPLAYRLDDSSLWNLGTKSFLKGSNIPQKLLLIQPYEPGRIPIVFIHGTASSAVWWAEMFNTLRADPAIRKNFQFWFYQYNSSNLITYSAMELRRVIREAVEKLDPQHKDSAFEKMVMVGHSQGGLLAKLSVVNPGNALWQALSDRSLEEANLSAELKSLAAELLLFKPLPHVKRVVFIATPHRGSFLAALGWLRTAVSKIISLPANLLLPSTESWREGTSNLQLPKSMRSRIPSSIDGMSSDNPVLQALARLPLAPGVSGHSIIAVKPGMEVETGNDGVVEYSSAHLDGMHSEYLVRAGHSCQDNPFTIEEVRRILLEHLNSYGSPGSPGKGE
jgi:pimeloyl-ACP methyl ester carboxylesterase